jgi:hypothetical protein
MLETHFEHDVTLPWRITETGQGVVTCAPGKLTMTLKEATQREYSNAQISDYSRRHFSWRPPARMTVTARASAAADHLRGTAGFGFWNHPFAPGERGVHLPQAVWFFFSSPPSNMQLAHGVPGPGWKAATLDATRWPFFALLPSAPIGLLVMRIPTLYNTLWPIGQRAIGVSEALLDGALLAETHTYTIDWRDDGATFAIDGQTVHEADAAPRGPLGFVAWMDNQYAIVTPQGQFGFGAVRVEREQALVLEHVATTCQT